MEKIITYINDFFKRRKLERENHFKLNNNDPDFLLREATAQKDAKNIEYAILFLRRAYEEIRKTEIEYDINTFIRLPLYLQQAKRFDEAWDEFNKLLISGYPNQTKDKVINCYIKSKIYDKMRLSLQREKYFDLAVKYGVFSELYQVIGDIKQKRYTKKDAIDREAIESIVYYFLKKTNKFHLLDKVTDIVELYIKKLPNIDFKLLGEEIDKIITS